MRLSQNFTLEEMVASTTARRLGIVNAPNDAQIENLRLLCVNVLEPIRSLIGFPIHVDSGYRCPKLNSAIGGSTGSQHMRGQAADITSEVTPQQIFDVVSKSGIEYDQMIQEFNEWVHISFSLGHNRMSRQTAYKDSEGKTVYVTA